MLRYYQMNIETKVAELEKLVEEYNGLSDVDKINRTELYARIVGLKAEYGKAIVELKGQLEMVNDVIVDDVQLMPLFLDKVTQLQIMFESGNIEECVALYKEVNGIKTKLDSYLEIKKMEVIKI